MEKLNNTSQVWRRAKQHSSASAYAAGDCVRQYYRGATSSSPVMARVIENVFVSSVTEQGLFTPWYDHPVTLEIIQTGCGAQINILKGRDVVTNIPVVTGTELCRLGRLGLLVTRENSASTMLRFHSENDMRAVQTRLSDCTTNKKTSVFSERTDQASAAQYFQFYSYLSQQQNMLQDYVRTSTYQRALLANAVDVTGKVVLDVGAGSGILSFFAVQAGARKVYAVEASSMAQFCEKLIKHNHMSDKIAVIPGKIEEIELPESVDIIVSEPIGYMLFNERMLESYVHARKFLRPGGRMFPTQGDLYIAPFQDEALYMEQSAKANFWCSESFYCVDLTCLRSDAFQEYFKQPIVDTFDIRICLAQAYRYTVNFETCSESDLHVIHVPLTFTMATAGTIHGLAFWFDLAFVGSTETIWLSTAPSEPLTHWYQVRCLLQRPVMVKQGQRVTGSLTLRSNSRQSYDVDICVDIPNTSLKSTNTLDLKNPCFRYTGVVAPAPQSHSTMSPTEQYYSSSSAATTSAGSLSATAYNGYMNGSATDMSAAQHQPQQTMLLQQQQPQTVLLQQQQQQHHPSFPAGAPSALIPSCVPVVIGGSGVGGGHPPHRSFVGNNGASMYAQQVQGSGVFGGNGVPTMTDYVLANNDGTASLAGMHHQQHCI